MGDRQLCSMHMDGKKLGNVGNIYVQSLLNAFLVVVNYYLTWKD